MPALASSTFDPANVNLNMAASDSVLQAQISCFLQLGENEYSGDLGSRVSSVFVILVVSTVFTVFPVFAGRVHWIKIPLDFYFFARYFGAGVIIATAFIHLLDPAYQEIGPQSCVGMTGNWTVFSWPPALKLFMVMLIFIIDLVAQRYIETKYKVQLRHCDAVLIASEDADRLFGPCDHVRGIDGLLSTNSRDNDIEESSTHIPNKISTSEATTSPTPDIKASPSSEEDQEALRKQSFSTQITTFLVMEFGIIFHSIIIGLNLGTSGPEFSVLYPVLVFHQSFEGLGIGARMSAIQFPKHLNWLPWALCAAYGLTTPVSIAAGLGVRQSYNGESYASNVISGVFDSLSAGVLIYTGLVELLARDFFCNKADLPKNGKRMALIFVSLWLGTGIMAALAKWI